MLVEKATQVFEDVEKAQVCTTYMNILHSIRRKSQLKCEV